MTAQVRKIVMQTVVYTKKTSNELMDLLSAFLNSVDPGVWQTNLISDKILTEEERKRELE